MRLQYAGGACEGAALNHSNKRSLQNRAEIPNRGFAMTGNKPKTVRRISWQEERL